MLPCLGKVMFENYKVVTSIYIENSVGTQKDKIRSILKYTLMQ